MADTSLPALRVDVWLWAARFFKTRSLCRQAIDGGKVAVNGGPCKPSRMLHVGDHLHVTRGDERFEVEVLALSDRRGPASTAQQLYRESAESLAVRAAGRETRRLVGAAAPLRRPDKADRRRIRALKHPG